MSPTPMIIFIIIYVLGILITTWVQLMMYYIDDEGPLAEMKRFLRDKMSFPILFMPLTTLPIAFIISGLWPILLYSLAVRRERKKRGR